MDFLFILSFQHEIKLNHKTFFTFVFFVCVDWGGGSRFGRRVKVTQLLLSDFILAMSENFLYQAYKLSFVARRNKNYKHRYMSVRVKLLFTIVKSHFKAVTTSNNDET